MCDWDVGRLEASVIDIKSGKDRFFLSTVFMAVTDIPSTQIG